MRSTRSCSYDAETVELARAMCAPDNLWGSQYRPLFECVNDPPTVRRIIEALVD